MGPDRKEPPIFALDTETNRGRAFLVCIENSSRKFLQREPKNIDHILAIFDHLCKGKYGRTGFAFNLDYDVLALLKYFPLESLSLLYVTNEFKYKNYKIVFVRKKFFRVVDTFTKKGFTIYDLFQYFNCSLNKASKKYLGEKKLEVSKKLMPKLYAYYMESTRNKNRIRAYCKQDTLLTLKLAVKLIKALRACGIKSTQYYSCGYLASQYLKQKGVRYETLSNEPMQDFVKDSYFGGRIEFVKRGMMRKVYQYDICSAYPDPTRHLENITGYSFHKRIDPQAKYYFVEAIVTIPKGFVSPVAVRTNGLVTYPTGKVKGTFDSFTWDRIKHLPNLITKVLNVYTDGTKPFKKVVETLYKSRFVGNDLEKYVFKIILNSVYGRFAFKRTDYETTDELTALLQLDRYVKKTSGGVIFTKWGVYKKVTRYHKSSNLVYASLITGYVRGVLYEVANLLGENFIGCMTDSVYSYAPLPVKYVTKSKELGKFELQKKGFIYVVGSGVYETKEATKFRGFNTNYSLIHLAKKNKSKDVFKISSTEKPGLGKIVLQGVDLDQLNVIGGNRKKLNLNFDKKRIWERDFKNFGDSLKHSIVSKPLILK